MTIVHHKGRTKTAADDGQTHVEDTELNRHHCGASKEWMMHHDFYQYGHNTIDGYDPSNVHNKDGKVWHEDAVGDGTAPECSCECEHTSLAPVQKLRDFLAAYAVNPNIKFGNAQVDGTLNTYTKDSMHDV